MLWTKLHIPQPKKNLVHRPYLFEKLNEGFNRKLILVSATAGYGKTTLLSDWIHRNKIPTVWYSVDQSDNDPGEFLTSIIKGIQTIHARHIYVQYYKISCQGFQFFQGFFAGES